MNTTSTGQDWSPKQVPARHADTTADIHRTIAWIYGVLGLLIVAVFAFASMGSVREHEWGAAAAVALFFGAVVALHAALAVGARNRNGIAKTGSVIVGVLMLFGFPIGTIVGGLLIYNSTQNWPPKRLQQVGGAGPDLRDL
ncbi:hypothetical protein [Scleromatobacter humisilvae]|uniref:Uncharacterized protein n=1 Tax=Scleromatobacter humisilvae TaxID=2897159 RepID=A0A9X1YDH1_9BURK|nr:hypothetical protein [Scleromatobacter humisilvae]MCK9684519.1 hypothetical protein [Scleromatobacter humisilvae]